MINFAVSLVIAIVIIVAVVWVCRWKKVNFWPEGFEDEDNDAREPPSFEFPKINRDRWGRWFTEDD